MGIGPVYFTQLSEASPGDDIDYRNWSYPAFSGPPNTPPYNYCDMTGTQPQGSYWLVAQEPDLSGSGYPISYVSGATKATVDFHLGACIGADNSDGGFGYVVELFDFYGNTLGSVSGTLPVAFRSDTYPQPPESWFSVNISLLAAVNGIQVAGLQVRIRFTAPNQDATFYYVYLDSIRISLDGFWDAIVGEKTCADYYYFTTVTQDSSNAWNNPQAAALAPDGVFAKATTDGGMLLFTGWQGSIPAYSIVTDVLVDLYGSVYNGGPGDEDTVRAGLIIDGAVVGSGNIGGVAPFTNAAQWTNDLPNLIYEVSGLTSAQVNSTNFGFWFYWLDIGEPQPLLQIDSARMKLCYISRSMCVKQERKTSRDVGQIVYAYGARRRVLDKMYIRQGSRQAFNFNRDERLDRFRGISLPSRPLKFQQLEAPTRRRRTPVALF